MAPTPITKPLIVVFRKVDDEWTVYGFRVSRFGDLRLIDEDKRDMSHHQVLWTIRGLQDQVLQSVKQKTVQVDLFEATWNKYVNGTYSTEFDGVVQEESGAAAREEASAPEMSWNSRANPDMDTLATFMREMIKINQESNQSLMSNVMQLVGRKDTQRMVINKFDGSNEDPKTWMTMFERACETNNWYGDDMRINNIKSYLVSGSAADKWFQSRIVDHDCQQADFTTWKLAFFAAFTQNRVQTANKALNWQYRSGPIMEYFWEKERLLKIAFPDIQSDTFISLMLCGLPTHLQTIALAMDPSDKTTLVQCMQRLPATAKPLRSDDQKTRINSQSYEQRPKFPVRGNDKDKKSSKKEDKSKQGRVNTVREITDLKDKPKKEIQESDFVNAVITQHPDYSALDILPLSLNGITVNAMLDTGASMDLVSASVVSQNQWETSPDKKIAVSFNNTPFIIKESVQVTISGSLDAVVLPEIKITAFVCQDLSFDCILSNPTMKRLNIVLGITQAERITSLMIEKDNLIRNFEDVKRRFPGILETKKLPKHEVAFTVKVDAAPVQNKPRRLSREKYFWTQTKIEEWKKKGFIVESTSPWASPIVVVPKSNTPEEKDFRLCIDYRTINLLAPLDPFPFPIIDDVIVSLGGCNVFSKIDLKDGFHLLGLTAESRKYSAFVTPFGQYEWTRLPFGYKNSPQLFQRVMTRILGELLQDRRVVCYIDDILIGTKSMQENQSLVFQVLERLDLNGLTINYKKCSFCVPSVEFLGRIIDGNTRTTKEESVQKVRNMKEPVNRHTLMVFLGLVGHFQHFLPNFASIARPLNNLKKKDVEWNFDENCKIAFKTLVDLITQNPILSLPDWSLPFELVTDASNFGTGAILYQRDLSKPRKQQLRVIGYYSYTFTAAEVNYNTSEKECLAVKKAVYYFRSYLEGKQFSLFTDHQALESLMKMTEPKGRLCRWQVDLMSYSFTINHRAGKLLQDADAISRLCLDIPVVNPVNSVLQLKDDGSISPTNETKTLILRRYHDDPDSGGHDGVQRTIYKIRNRFPSWNGLTQDIKEYIKNCQVCQMTKFRFKQKYDLMILSNHSDKPFHTIHLDYGELQKKAEGVAKTKSFIVLVDEFTRMVFTKPIRENTRSLIEWLKTLPVFNSIKVIVSDNGPSFSSKAMEDFTRDNNIRHIFTAVYHPESNGLAERKIRDLKMYFDLYPNFKWGWKKCLELATKHQNNSYHSGIGCSPLFKYTGQVPRLPADKEFGVNHDKIIETPFTEAKVKAKRIKVRDYVNSKRLNSPPDIKVGDEIIYQSGLDGRKPKVKGPSVIKRVISKDSFPKTLIVEENGKDKAVSMKDALPFYQRTSSSKICYLFVAVLCLITPDTEAVFAKESPILWMKSSSSVIDTVINVNHTVIFQSICDVLKPSKLITASQSNQLKYWCLHETSQALLPLQQICSHKQGHTLGKRTTELERPKRELLTTLVIGVFTILANTAVTWYFVAPNREALRDIERKFNILQNENSRFEAHLRALAKDLEVVVERLDHLEDKVDYLQQTYPQVSILITDVNTQIHHVKEVTTKLVRNWQSEALVPSVVFDFLVPAVPNKFGIFMSQLHQLPNNALLEEAKAQSCSVDMDTKLLSLQYQVPLRKNDTAIHEALAFQIQMNFTDDTTHETMTCLMEYIGPKYVTTDFNCTRILDVPANVIGKLQFLHDSSIECHETPTTQLVYWRKKLNTCIKASEARFPSQLVMTLSGAFVYCFGHDVTIGKQKFKCPNYVFRLTLEQDFRIAGYHYSPRILRMSYQNFSMSDHLRINEQIYPHSYLDPILADLKRVEKELDSEFIYKWEDYLYHPSMYVVLSLGLVCLILVILLYCCWKQIASNQTFVFRARNQERQEKIAMDTLGKPEGGFISE